MSMAMARRRGELGTVISSRPRRQDIPDPPDDEWDAFISLVEDVETASDNLISEFAKKSKEQGQCVLYLRKLINRTFKRHQMHPEEEEKCANTILRALFQLTLRSWSIAENVLGDLLSLGMTEVRHFSSAALSSIIFDYALEYMVSNEKSELPVGWIDVFGKVASALTTRGDITLGGDVVDGKQFRKNIVLEICRMDWSKTIVTSLVKILEEIPGIEVTEVNIILETLGNSLKSMNSTAIPDVMKRIVTLTGPFRAALLLKTCDDYFGAAQSLLKDSKKGSKETLEVRAKRNSLATVAFHFVDASRHCDSIVREVLKRVRASVYDHTLVMTPFTLAVVLGMTSVDYLKPSIVEPLKIAIIKSFHELNLSKASKWYRNTRGEVLNEITDCFKAVLQSRSSALEYMSDGLKDLGVGLLSADSLQWKYPMTSKPCTDLGLFLITTIVQSNKAYLGTVMNELLKHKTTPHIGCLAACLSLSSRAVGHRDFHGRMHELMQHLPLMSVETVSVIVKSLIPALQMSPMLLDELMMVLRKTFWKSVESGRICVEAMCVILSKSVVVGNIPLDEMRGPGGSDDLLFSQCTQGASQSRAKSAVDFAPLCFEILSMAKRFFLLDCQVREQLYLGLHRVSRSNPLLTEIICGQLLTHASQYIPSVTIEEVTKDSVTLKHLFEFSSTNLGFVAVKDELGFLVQCIGFAVLKAHPIAVESESYRSCKAMLGNWITFASTIEIDILEVIASSILGDAGGSRPIESARYVKEVLVMQTMQVITALIEYISLSCMGESVVPGIKPFRNADTRVSKLYRKYRELETCMKEDAVAKKSDKTMGNKIKKNNKKKVDALNDSDNDTASIASGVESCNPSAKMKKVEVLLKPVYYPLINLDSVCQMLREVYGITTQNKALNTVKESDGFEMILLDTIKQKVTRLKQKKSIRERQRAPVDAHNALSLITNIIWKRLCAMIEIQRTTESLPDSTEVVETRLEVISEILDFFYKESLIDRVLDFNLICKSSDFQRSEDDPEARNKLASELFEQWKLVLQLVSKFFDGVQGSSNPLLFIVLNLVCKVMPPLNTLDTIRKWTWEYLKNDQDANEGTLDLLDNVVTLFTTCTSKCCTFPMNRANDILRLSKAVRIVIGDVEGDEGENRQPSWLITAGTAPTLVCSIATFVEQQLCMVGSILGRLKAHGHYLSIEKNAKMREKCYEMIDCVRLISTELVRTAFPAGPCVTSLLKVIPQIYNVMANFAEYLLDLCKNKINKVEGTLNSFKTLVGALGKDFKIGIETMIQHTEYIQRQKLEELAALANNKKGKKTSKVPAAMKHQFTKDAKLIPNMVYHIERFEKQIIALSNKVQVDMHYDMKLSTARDFRIETVKFNEAVAEKDNLERSRVGTARTDASDETSDGSMLQQEVVVKPKKGRKRK